MERKVSGHRSDRVAIRASPQTAKHNLDAVAALVALFVVLHRPLARLPARNANIYPLVFQRFL